MLHPGSAPPGAGKQHAGMQLLEQKLAARDAPNAPSVARAALSDRDSSPDISGKQFRAT